MRKVCLVLGLTGLRVFGFLTDPWLSDREIHRIVGEPTRIVQAAPAGSDLSVVTWNIEHGAAYEAIVNVLRRLDSDVVLLQEVDRDCHRTQYRDVGIAHHHGHRESTDGAEQHHALDAEI